jgi:hypothetical protein
MTSLRESIDTLIKYSHEDALNLSDVYKFLQMDVPLTVAEIMDRIESLPESIPFHAKIVTAVALGGEVFLVLNRDGSYRFSGFMRATGAFSFSFRVGVVVRSASGQVSLALQSTGEVFGTDTPGERQFDWDERHLKFDETSRLLRNLWPDLVGGRMSVRTTSDLSGTLATVGGILKDVVEILIVAETLGAGLAICVVIGSELGNVDLRMPGVGGVIGIGIIAGGVIIWGPLAIGPAFLVGVTTGLIVDALIKIRRMEPPEMDFAKQVFGNSLDFEMIRVTNMVGLGNAPFTLPTIDNHILVNIGVSDAMYDAPTTTASPRWGPTRGQLLIHELTHAWQIQHATLAGGYVPGWLCTGIDEQVIIGSRSYNYGDAGPPWDSLHNEAQAHIVDEWFAGTGQQSPDRLPPELVPRPDPRMNPDSPYFGYIENDIRTAVM